MSFRKTPYEKFVLVEKEGTHKEAEGNFPELVMLMKPYNVTGSVYIDYAPAYIILLIGKTTK